MNTETKLTWEQYHEQKLSKINELVLQEINHAKAKHTGNFNSRHEAYAILLEEVEELWHEIKTDADDSRVIAEAVQVIAVCYRLLTEVTGKRG